LPWRHRRGEDFGDAQALHAPLEPFAIDAVAITDEVGRARIRPGRH
jgi:hypothetical protein